MNGSTNLVDMLTNYSQDLPGAFPNNGRVNYANRYKQIAEYLNIHFHPQVEKSALFQDGRYIRAVLAENMTVLDDLLQGEGIDSDKQKKIAKWKEDGIPSLVYLNDHGTEHISMVIQRASDLSHFSQCKLTPYEIYILLISIHMHDVGNVYGRDGHEKKISDIMNTSQIKGFIDDSTERRMIKQIASAHGGYVNGDRDTFGRLSEAEPYLGYHVRIVSDKYLPPSALRSISG